MSAFKKCRCKIKLKCVFKLRCSVVITKRAAQIMSNIPSVKRTRTYLRRTTYSCQFYSNVGDMALQPPGM